MKMEFVQDFVLGLGILGGGRLLRRWADDSSLSGILTKPGQPLR